MQEQQAPVLLLDEVLSQKSRLKTVQEKARKQVITYDQSSASFNQIMEDMLELLRELERPAQEEAKQAILYLTSITRPRLSGNQVIGRKRDLDLMAEQIQEGNDHLLITGIGGIGKTTLAGYYLEQFEHKYRHIAWVNFLGDFKADLVNQLNNHNILNVEYSDQQSVESRFEQLVFALQGLDGPNLLIVDNLNTEEEAAELRRHLPYIPGNWKLLVTSRVGMQEFIQFPLGVLQEQAATQLFERYYKARGEAEKTALQQLLEQVGYHTLVIELLAKTLAELENLTIQKLHQRILNKGLTELKIKVDVNVAHNQQQTVRLSQYITTLYDLAPLSEEEKNLLVRFSVLPNSPLNFEQWCNIQYIYEEEEQDEFMYLLSQLRQKGWIEKTESGYPATYFMSPVMQEVIRSKIPPTFEACEPLFYYFNAKIKEVYTENPLETLPFLPYALSLLDHLKEENEDIAVLTGTMALIYRTMGQYSQAFDWQKRALDYFEKEPDKHQFNLCLTYNNLSLLFNDQGDYDMALQFQLKALEIGEQLPEGEFDRALAYNNLAMMYKDRAELDTALRYGNMALEEYHNQDPVQYGPLGLAYNNVSLLYQMLGQHEKSLELQKEAIRYMEEHIDEEHPNLAMAYNNMGHLLHLMGNYKDSLDFLFRALDLGNRIYDEGHPFLAQPLNNIAFTYREMGDYAKALDFHQKALETFQRSLPAHHPFIATAYSNLSLVYQSMKDTDKALEYELMSTKIRETNPEISRLELAISYNNLALLELGRKNMERAEELLLKAHELRLSVLEENHPEIALSFHNLAQLYKDKGDLETALDFQLKSIDIYQKTVEENHPRLALAYHNLGTIYLDRKEYQSSAGSLALAIQGWENSQLGHLPEVGSAYHNLSYALFLSNDLPSAKLTIGKAIENYQHQYPDGGHPAMQLALDLLQAIENSMADPEA